MPKSIEEKRLYAREYYQKNKEKIHAQRKILYTRNKTKKNKLILLLELHRRFLLNKNSY